MNNHGFSLFSIMLINSLASLLLWQHLQYLRSKDHIKDRTEIYLCFKSNHKINLNYIKKMKLFNHKISLLNKAILIPHLKVASLKLKKALQVTQDLQHVSYLKNLFFQKHCYLTHKALVLKNKPYKSSFEKLERSLGGLAKFEKRIWQMSLRSKKGILLRVQYDLKLGKTVKTEEVRSGSLSFFSL